MVKDTIITLSNAHVRVKKNRSMQKGIIVLNTPIYTRYLKKYGSVSCIHCKGELPLRGRAFSKAVGRRGVNVHHVLYCLKCADELNLI
jgi:hypothetical protein